MTILAITGLLCTEDNLLSPLNEAGLSIAGRDNHNGEIMSLQHDILGTNRTDNGLYSHPEGIDPDEPWLIQGKNIISQFNGQTWAWADNNTSLLLDYWHKVEPQIRFLLIYQPPWITIDQLFRVDNEQIINNPGTALREWLYYNRLILNFYRNHKEQSVLINSAYLSHHMSMLLYLLNEKFNLNLKSVTWYEPDHQAVEVKMNSVFPVTLAQAAPEAIECYLELESCAELLGRQPDFKCQDLLFTPLTEQDLLEEWSKQCTDRLKAESQIHDLNDEIKKLKYTQEIIQNNLETRENENTILLLQLNQAQSELEEYYQRYQEHLKAARTTLHDGSDPEVQAEYITGKKKSLITRFISYLRTKLSTTVILRRNKDLKIQLRQIRKSGLFDETWYLAEYQDVARGCLDPVIHYLLYGSKEGRNPSREFDTSWYLKAYPDVVDAGINPLLHYIQHGRDEDRKPRELL